MHLLNQKTVLNVGTINAFNGCSFHVLDDKNQGVVTRFCLCRALCSWNVHTASSQSLLTLDIVHGSSDGDSGLVNGRYGIDAWLAKPVLCSTEESHTSVEMRKNINNGQLVNALWKIGNRPTCEHHRII